MSTVLETLCSGVWKFSPDVPAETLIALAEKWRDEPDGDKYEMLHVRRDLKKTWAIAFSYRFEDQEKGHQPYFYKMSDSLKRKFGNDLVGWDISGHTYVVK